MSTSFDLHIFCEFQMVELIADPSYPPSKDHQSNFTPRSRCIQGLVTEGLVLLPWYSHNTPEILSSLNIWARTSDFSFFSRYFLDIRALCRSPLGTQRWITVVLLSSLFFEYPPPLSWILREFKMVTLFGDLTYPLSIDQESKLLPRSEDIPWIFQERLLCRTDALDLGVLMIWDRK